MHILPLVVAPVLEGTPSFLCRADTSMLHLRFHRAALLGNVLLIAGVGASHLLFSGSPMAADPESLSKTDPARARPIVVSVRVSVPGATPEEVERQVAVPLEVNLAGMPGLDSLRSESLTGVGCVYAAFRPGTTYTAARQEVINRLQLAPLASGITPTLGARATRHSLRYLLTGPRDSLGHPVYTPQDLGILQEWVLEREFRRLAGVAEVYSAGGVSKRYEIHPEPDRVRRYGITLNELADAIAGGNANVGGDFLAQGKTVHLVRSVGTFGGGVDPVNAQVLHAEMPEKAARLLRDAERRRILEIRNQVVARVNNVPIKVEDLVEGGPSAEPGAPGVVVGSQPRASRVGVRGPGPVQDKEVVEGVIWLRPDADAEALRSVQARIQELNTTAGKLLPGVRIEPVFVSPQERDPVIWIYGTLPLHVSLAAAAEVAGKVRDELHTLPEVERIVSQVGGSVHAPRPFSQMQFFLRLKTAKPAQERQKRILAIQRLLSSRFPGVDWLTTTNDPEDLDQTFPAIPAEHLLMIRGPDLDKLETLAERVKGELAKVRGVDNVGVFHTLGQARLELRLDAEKCKRFGVMTAEVNLVLQAALGGKVISQMVEGEKQFDITLLWPTRLRSDQLAILNLPVDVGNRPGQGPGDGQPLGKGELPRLLVRDLVAPLGDDGEPAPRQPFLRRGASAIYRNRGTRLLPIRFSVRGRPWAEVQAEATQRIEPFLRAPYRIEWSDPVQN
jgi:Cu/Ag efflux pump CusA